MSEPSVDVGEDDVRGYAMLLRLPALIILALVSFRFAGCW